MVRFIKAYIKSMRLYYSFVTGIAGWLGVAYYEYLANTPAERSIEIAPAPEKKSLRSPSRKPQTLSITCG